MFETEHGDGKLLGHVMMFSLLNGSKKKEKKIGSGRYA
jgi:hypothetical protein